MYVCMYVCKYMHMCICVHAYIYIYIYMLFYIYILYIYIYVRWWKCPCWAPTSKCPGLKTAWPQRSHYNLI